MTAASVDSVLGLYDRWGTDHYDEHLSQVDHALQTAALAAAAGAPEPLVAAALLHDVGHLLDLEAGGRPGAGRDDRHEATGASHLAPVFPPSITQPIALHVEAKRYRCAVDPAYHQQLSPGSVASLERQGGPMDAAEVAAFARRPGFEPAVLLRSWDDQGKVDGLDVASVEEYRPLLLRMARER